MVEIVLGPIGVGTRYRAKWKQSKLINVECTAYDRPHTWTYVNGGPVTVVLTIRLSPEPVGTRLEATFDATPKGMFRLVFPVFVQVMKRQERKNMVNLKAALENGEAPSSPGLPAKFSPALAVPGASPPGQRRDDLPYQVHAPRSSGPGSCSVGEYAAARRIPRPLRSLREV